jgi:hypothetical protein
VGSGSIHVLPAQEVCERAFAFALTPQFGPEPQQTQQRRKKFFFFKTWSVILEI